METRLRGASLIAANNLRVLGFTFLLLYAEHRLPAPFAPLAGSKTTKLSPACGCPTSEGVPRPLSGNEATLAQLLPLSVLFCKPS